MSLKISSSPDSAAELKSQGRIRRCQSRPEYRHLARRAQVLGRYPYGEIRDNLIAEGCSPLDILRFKLSFFGAAKFDPKSSLWTRITMFQGAPLMSELEQPWADDWWLSVAPQNV